MTKLAEIAAAKADFGRCRGWIHRCRIHLPRKRAKTGFAVSRIGPANVADKHRKLIKIPPNPLKPQSGTFFSIRWRSQGAGSRRPCSDNHRSRNLWIARKPKTNTPLGQEDPGSLPRSNT